MCRSPVAGGGADFEEEVIDELGAERGVMHLGMELHGPDAAVFVGDAGQGVEVTAVRWKPAGSSRASSPWLIHTCNDCGRPVNRAVALSSIVTSAWPYSRLGADFTLPPM